MESVTLCFKKIQEAKVLNAELTHLKSNAVSYYFYKVSFKQFIWLQIRKYMNDKCPHQIYFFLLKTLSLL